MTGDGAVTVVSTSGFLGYGFPEDSLRRALAHRPQVIACDAGTNDAGPYYLGSGESMASAAACRRDLDLMLAAAQELGVPVIVGSAWTAGTNAGVDRLCDLVRSIARERGHRLRLARLYSEVDGDRLHDLHGRGLVRRMDGENAPLDESDLRDCARAVCAMGAAPIIAALNEGADVVVAGRASDAALFAAVPLREGKPPSRAWHAGRILECGACAAEPADAGDCLVAEVGDSWARLSVPNPQLRCTVESVAGHMLYETRHPHLFVEPDGTLDISQVEYAEDGDGGVRITGEATFTPGPSHSMRVEAVSHRGFRAMTFGGVRDPALLKDGASALDTLRSEMEARVADVIAPPAGSWSMQMTVYGGGATEASPAAETRDRYPLGVLLDVVASSQEQADAILAVARAYLVHGDFPGRLNTNAGNLAFPFSPSDVALGEVFEFLPGLVVEPESPWDVIEMQLEAVA